jgi:hypothetical protein
VDKHIIDAEIVNGTHAGDRVFIPRIVMSLSKDLSLPFKFKRKQFPVRFQQGIGPDATNCWCISTRTSVFTWAIICCLIEGCVSRHHLDAM